METIETGDPERWDAALRAVGAHDFYHLCGYHRIAEARGEGRALLLTGAAGAGRFALPLLVRPIPASDRCDAISAYGYPGLLTAGAVDPEALADALRTALAGRGVVTVFGRLHPILSDASVLAKLGTVRDEGPTVSIDLSLGADGARAAYRSNHRRDLRKLAATGHVCGEERGPAAIADFVRVYVDTMRRVGAGDAYLFDEAYVEALLALPGLALLLCCRDGSVRAGAIVSATGGVAQYHLGGTIGAALADAPMKLVFDIARGWATERGARLLHLGGGLGAREDALFHFKAGFGTVRHRFSTWRWIVEPEAAIALGGAEAGADGFFPAYRSPSRR